MKVEEGVGEEVKMDCLLFPLQVVFSSIEEASPTSPLNSVTLKEVRYFTFSSSLRYFPTISID